jgi:hypothetical protein
MKLATTSTEYVRVAVTGPPGIDLTTTTPRMAFLPRGTHTNPTPADWHTGAWLDGRILVLVGPDGGATALTPGHYWVWIHVDPPGAENVVTRAPGSLTIY